MSRLSDVNETQPLLITESTLPLSPPSQQPKNWRCLRVCARVTICILLLILIVSFSLYVYVPPIVQMHMDNSPPPEVTRITFLNFTEDGIKCQFEGKLSHSIPPILSRIGFNVVLRGSTWNLTVNTWPNGTEFGGQIGLADLPDIFIQPGDESFLNMTITLRETNKEFLKQLNSGDYKVLNVTLVATTTTDLKMFDGRFYWETIRLYKTTDIELKHDQKPDDETKKPQEPTEHLWERLNFTIVHKQFSYKTFAFNCSIEFDNPEIFEANNPGILDLDVLYDNQDLAHLTISDFNLNAQKRSGFNVNGHLNAKGRLFSWGKLLNKIRKKEYFDIEIKNLQFKAHTANGTKSIEWIDYIFNPIDMNVTVPVDILG